MMDTKNRGKSRAVAVFAGPAQRLHWPADCERRLNPRGLFQLNHIPPASGL